MLINYQRRIQRLVDLTSAEGEAALRRQFARHHVEKSERSRLARWAVTEDSTLVDRLVSAGFNSQNIAALSYTPIFEAAWASGSVTRAEQRVLEAEVFREPIGDAPRKKLESWLRRRPSRSLGELWRDFTLSRIAKLPWKQRIRSGRRVLRPATRVAAASGGLWDLGEICRAEREVLQRIESVYQLN